MSHFAAVVVGLAIVAALCNPLLGPIELRGLGLFLGGEGKEDGMC